MLAHPPVWVSVKSSALEAGGFSASFSAAIVCLFELDRSPIWVQVLFGKIKQRG